MENQLQLQSQLQSQPHDPRYVFVSVKGKDRSKIDGVFVDENIAMIKKCKECVIVKMIVDETRFVSL